MQMPMAGDTMWPESDACAHPAWSILIMRNSNRWNKLCLNGDYSSHNLAILHVAENCNAEPGRLCYIDRKNGASGFERNTDAPLLLSVGEF